MPNTDDNPLAAGKNEARSQGPDAAGPNPAMQASDHNSPVRPYHCDYCHVSSVEHSRCGDPNCRCHCRSQSNSADARNFWDDADLTIEQIAARRLQDARDLTDERVREFWERLVIVAFERPGSSLSVSHVAGLADAMTDEWRKRFAPPTEEK